MSRLSKGLRRASRNGPPCARHADSSITAETPTEQRGTPACAKYACVRFPPAALTCMRVLEIPARDGCASPAHDPPLQLPADVALTFISPSTCCTVHNMHNGEQGEGQLTAATEHHFIPLEMTARPKQNDTPLGVNPPSPPRHSSRQDARVFTSRGFAF